MAQASAGDKFSRQFRRFLGNSSGNATIFVALAAIPMVAAAGLALDYLRSARTASELQYLADAAALAGASATNVTGTASQQLAQRAAIATTYINASLANITDAELVGSPGVVTGPNTVDVQVNAKVIGSLINALNAFPSEDAEMGGDGGGGTEAGETGSKDTNVAVSSKAAFSKDSYLCLLSTNMTEEDSIYFNGNSEFTASVCTVQANSNHATAMRTWGSAEATSDGFCAVGGWAGTSFVPTPEAGCTTKLDPYTDLLLPTVGACDFTNKKVKNATASLTPGVYCGGIDLSTHAIANFAPGLYIIKDGELDLGSHSTLNAPVGVVFYLTGNTAKVYIASGGAVTINAPKPGEGVGQSGNYIGFAFMQDRTNGIANENVIQSGGDVNINGAFYASNQILTVWANGDMNGTSSYFPIIVNKFEMSGNATLHVKLDWEAAGYPEPTDLKVEGEVLLTQ